MHAKKSLVRPRLVGAALLIVAIAAAATPTFSADWPQFRNGLVRANYTSEQFAPTMTLVWKFTTAPALKRVPPVVVGNRVYVAAGTQMFCLDVATGSQQWSYDATSTILGPPAFGEGRVFFGAESGHVIAVDAADGKELWRVATARPVRASPAVVDGTVYVASLDKRVVAVDAATGTQKWSRILTDEIWGAPTVTEGRVYVATADAQIWALDAYRGRTLTQVTLPQRRAVLNPLVVTDNAIYIVGRTDVRALSLRGTQRWVRQFDTYVAGAPAFADGMLYVALINGRVMALDAARGLNKWQFDLGAPMSNPPTLVGNVLVVGSVGGIMYALDAANGAIRWRYEARPPGLAEGVNLGFDLVAPAVYADNSLYVIWSDGSLARFDGRWPDPARPTITRLTPAEGRLVDSDTTTIVGAQVFDEDCGLDAAGLTMTMDDKPLEARFDPYTGYFTYRVSSSSGLGTLEPGWHTVTVGARDQRGNTSSLTWRFVAWPGADLLLAPAATTATTGAAGTGQTGPTAVRQEPVFEQMPWLSRGRDER